jgi:hypothetical protein
MQSFPAPHLVDREPALARRRLTLPLAALGLVLLVGALALTVGGSSTPSRSGPARHTALIGGVPLQQARCAQWVAGSAAERRDTLAALASVVGGPTQYGPATRLSDPQATALFDRACSSRIANGFLLYELYIRAAGYRSYLPR